MKYVQLVLRRPISFILILVAVVVFGLTSITSMQMEYFPDLNMPMEVVYILYPGADADSVESLVVEPIEDAAETLTGIKTISSESHENYGTVQLTYEYDTDLDDAYNELKSALDNLSGDFPDGCEAPTILEVSLDDDATISVAVESKDGSDITNYANDTVVPKLESLNGVASVDVSGAKERYCRIILNEEKMRQYGLSISQVASTIAATDFNMPVGNVDMGTQSIPATAYTDIEWNTGLTNISLQTSTGEIITLSNICDDISLHEDDPDTISRYNGMDSIIVGVNKKTSAETIAVCNQVEKTLSQLEDADVTFEVVHSAANDIMDTLKEVLKTLIEGIIITMIILMIFLGDWKASLIVGLSMPLSLFLALTALNFMNIPFDLMTGTGMIIAIGMLVDNSIVILESCFRQKEKGFSAKDAAATGAAAMLFSVLGSTITTVVVYAPISTATGMSGQMNKPLCYTIIFTMLASLIDAITVVPLLFMLLKPESKTDLPINKLLGVLEEKYKNIMPKLLVKPAMTLVTVAVLLVGSIALFAQLDFDIFPPSYDGSIEVTADFRSGTKLSVMDERISEIEQLLVEDENFSSVELVIDEGTATITAYSSDNSKRSSEQAVDEYTEMFKNYTDMDVNVTPTGVTTGLASLMSSGNSTTITIQGDNLENLEEGANLVEEAMKTVPGVQSVKNDFSSLRTSIRFHIDQQMAQYTGLQPANIATQIYSMLNGITATQIEAEDGNEYDIKVQFAEGEYNNPDVLLAQSITNSNGDMVALKDLCTLEHTESLQTIQRTDGKYSAEITATVNSDDKYNIANDVSIAVSKIEFPEGVAQAVSTVDQTLTEEMGTLGKALIIAIFLVFLVMAIQFESVKYSIMVMTCIPFSLIGSFTLMFVMQEKISMMAMMGILMLVGMVVNNGILLVDGVNQLKEQMPLKEALVQAGITRLRPILMTTLTTVLSMLPLLLSGNSGVNMMHGMGVVIVGGLITSTVLAMFVMPAFYLLLTKKENFSC